mgnify:CR=1 FL=1
MRVFHRTRQIMNQLRYLLLLSLLFLSCASTPEKTAVRWRVGADLANPPFAWVEEDGEVRGRDVEMAQALAKDMGVELVWVRMDFDRLLDSLAAGEIDSVIATLGSTPERATRVLLSMPYYSTSLRALVRVGEKEPKSLDELAGRPVSAGLGTTSELALRARLPQAIVAKPSEKGTTSIERLLAGEVDALVMDGPDALDYAREQPEELAVLQTALAQENYVVAIRPDAQDWLLRINSALARMHAAGKLKELDRKFGLEASRSEN